MTFSALPHAQGLYDPANEHDSCGVAFVVGLFGAIRVHVVRDWSQTHEAVAAGVRAPATTREALPAHGREVVGGLTPTVTLGEASALK